jgi:sugar phosphate permease
MSGESQLTAQYNAPAGFAAWLVWSVAVVFVLYLFGFQTGYSVANPSIQKEVGLTVSQVGLIAATYTWSFAVFQMFSGALLDRLGARRVLIPAIALVTVGVFVFAHATSFAGIITAQLILALGACAGFVGAGYVGGQWFGMAKFSFMFGLVQCFASLFSAFNQNLLAVALKRLEWRELFTWVGFLGIVIFILGLLFLRNPASIADVETNQGGNKFLIKLLSGILRVAKVGHVWVAAGYGALIFGALLAAGVVWAPKLMLARGLPASAANFAASVIWLGMAAGCIVFPWWSDAVSRRKLPALVGIALQLAALLGLIYLPHISSAVAMTLWLVFGFGAAAHMLAFSAAGDAVKLEQLGTCAAIVNGTMFLVSGLLIARPGEIAARLIESGAPAAMEIAQMALRPLALGLVVALVLAAVIRESHPKSSPIRRATDAPC